MYETKNNEAGKLVEVYKFEVKYSDEGADFFISQGATSDKSYPIGSKDSIKEGVRNVLWKLLDLTRDVRSEALSLRFRLIGLTRHIHRWNLFLKTVG